MRKNFILTTLLFLLINVLVGADENLPILVVIFITFLKYDKIKISYILWRIYEKKKDNLWIKKSLIWPKKFLLF